MEDYCNYEEIALFNGLQEIVFTIILVGPKDVMTSEVLCTLPFVVYAIFAQ